jgi:hypothetical protein
MRLNNKLTKEIFIERSIKVHGNKYDYSKINYVNIYTKVCIICKKHGEFWQRPCIHLHSKIGCIKCSYEYLVKKFLLGKEKFIKESIKVHGNKYNYDDVNYKGNKIKVLIKCKKHNHIFKQTPNHHLRGQKCLYCAKEESAEKISSKKREIFEERAKKIHGDIYKYIEKYKGCNKKINIFCTKCNTIFKQTPTQHLIGNGCSNHQKSKGQDTIINYFKNNNINFESEYMFKNLTGLGKGKLRFDFYLPDYNILIEYDGRQHKSNTKSFISKKYILSIEEINKLKMHDEMKNKYCIDNNIPLIRIPHTDFHNIENILNGRLLISKVA